MTPAELREVAVTFRTIVEKIAPLDRQFASLKRFPAGCCKDTSFLLARVLDQRFQVKRIEYVYGTRDSESLDWYTHGWLEIDGWILDVTADQFAEVDEPVVVVRRDSSVFHASFERQSRSTYPSFWSFHASAAPDFEHTFQTISALFGAA